MAPGTTRCRRGCGHSTREFAFAAMRSCSTRSPVQSRLFLVAKEQWAQPVALAPRQPLLPRDASRAATSTNPWGKQPDVLQLAAAARVLARARGAPADLVERALARARERPDRAECRDARHLGGCVARNTTSSSERWSRGRHRRLVIKRGANPVSQNRKRRVEKAIKTRNVNALMAMSRCQSE
jgi:hypothetical protein